LTADWIGERGSTALRSTRVDDCADLQLRSVCTGQRRPVGLDRKAVPPEIADQHDQHVAHGVHSQRGHIVAMATRTTTASTTTAAAGGTDARTDDSYSVVVRPLQPGTAQTRFVRQIARAIAFVFTSCDGAAEALSLAAAVAAAAERRTATRHGGGK